MYGPSVISMRGRAQQPLDCFMPSLRAEVNMTYDDDAKQSFIQCVKYRKLAVRCLVNAKLDQ
jgi:hypothetical protein